MPETDVTIFGSSMGKTTETKIPLMTEVIPGLWVGGACGSLLPEEIRHVVSLIGGIGYEVKHPLHSVLIAHWNDDAEQDLGQVGPMAQWVNSCFPTGPVLVHCGAGLNRSSVVAARAMMLTGMSADDAISLLRSRRSEYCLANPHFEKWLRRQDIQ
jgi:protein-tyrosine phosphatase